MNRGAEYECSALLALVGLAAAFAFPAAAHAEPGWSLKQSGKFLGPRDVLVCAHGLKVIDADAKMTMLAHAPDWKVTILNDRLKRSLAMPYQRAPVPVKVRTFFAYRLDLDDLEWEKKRSLVFKGMPAQEMRSIRRGTSNVVGRRQHSFAKSIGIEHANYIVGTVALPEQLRSIIHTLYLIPRLPGFPLDLSFFTPTGGDHKSALETDSIAKVDLQSKDFQTPAGYKVVASESELYGAEQEDEMGSWVDILGGDNAKGDTKKPKK